MVPPARVVIGVGHELGGDDAVGLVVARAVRDRVPRGVAVHESTGDGTALLDLWAGAACVVVVDAMRAGVPAGTVVRIDGRHEGQWPAGGPGSLTSSHAFGVLEAIALARPLGLLPSALIVYGVEGASFDLGAPLSAAVASAVPSLVERVVAEVTD
jgi:hydrogenase maturation protease